tara:strand:+ start:9762 stop:10301 length:540 start_codon:yes stop_codon:yes gene_type:complete
MENKILSEALEVYKTDRDFIVDSGLVKLFTFNKEVCDFENISVYNQQNLTNWLRIQSKSVQPFNYTGLNLETIAINSFFFARVRDMVKVILQNIYKYNKDKESNIKRVDLFKAFNVCCDSKEFFKGELVITEKKINIYKCSEGSEKELIVNFENNNIIESTIFNSIFDIFLKQDWATNL